MLRSLILCTLLLALFPGAVPAVVEYGPAGAPTTIQEVYMREGVAYLAIEDVLAPLGLSGQWDAVEHVYRVETSAGTVILSPGSHFLRLGDRFVPLEHRPRFIDGRLRVPEELAAVQLPRLLRVEVDFRNLNPGQADPPRPAGTLDQLFAALLLKKEPQAPAGFRALAIDAGHGGEDPGVIGGGAKEKDLVLDAARRLEKLAKMEWGIPVYMSRDGDYNVPVQSRFESVRPDTDAMLLLHAAGSFSPAVRGIELFIRPVDEAVGAPQEAGEGGSMRLARKLEAALKAEGLTVTGIYRAPLLPLGRGNLPTVLVELGYLTNPQDLALLTGEGRERIARALLRGARNFAQETPEGSNP